MRIHFNSILQDAFLSTLAELTIVLAKFLSPYNTVLDFYLFNIPVLTKS